MAGESFLRSISSRKYNHNVFAETVPERYSESRYLASEYSAGGALGTQEEHAERRAQRTFHATRPLCSGSHFLAACEA